jgi:AraC-like DNA-binding protein
MPERPAYITIIPPECRETFLNFPHRGKEAAQWFGNGVWFACISDLRKGYYVHREQCHHHTLILGAGGKGTFKTEGAEGEIRDGTLLFFPAGALHHYETDGRMRFAAMHLDPASPRWEYLRERGFIRGTSRRRSQILTLMRLLADESSSPETESPEAPELYCRLILSLIDTELRGGADPAETERRARLEKVWRLAERSLSAPWTVDSLARKAGMSPPHFFAVTRKLHGLSPMEILRNMRIARAKTLLRNSGKSVDETAALTGYNSRYSFSRAFKHAAGVPPARYRAGS